MAPNIYRDINFWLLSVNMLMVLLGYAFVYAMGVEFAALAKTTRLVFLFISIVVLIKSYSLAALRASVLRQQLVIFLIALFFVNVFFSEHLSYSIGRTLTFLVPFLYVFFCIKYFILKYGFNSTWYGFNSSVNWVYMVPLLTFLLAGANFELTNIYGNTKDEGLIFVSNHFGWASVIFLLTGVDLLISRRISKFYRLMIFIIGLLAIYLLLISGSRSSLLSIGLALVVFILFNRGVKFFYKMIIVSLIFYLGYNQYLQETSAVSTRYDATMEQLEEGEARELILMGTVESFNKDTSMWLFGIGLFNYEILMKKFGVKNYHNSYLEVLFGGGIFIFGFFVLLFVYIPVKNYITYYHKYSLVIFPILIIPFFESNLTGGQFLFFPWFGYTLLYSFDPRLIDSSTSHAPNHPKS